jgi:radical SAM superfamily enzyme YgiQ (UPF0313 family)
MADVARTADAGHFAFVDDLFPYSPVWVQKFAALLAERALGVTFSLAARADQVARRPDVLHVLKSAGCSSIEMGIESGSQSVLDRYQKDLTVAVNREAIHLVRKAGIRVMIDYIMFDPWSTMAELKESLDFLEAINAEATYPAVVYSSLSFYPGTPLYDRAIQLRAEPTTAELEWFEDPEVAAVHEIILSYRRERQSELNAEIEHWRRIHRKAVVHGDESQRKLAVEQMYLFRSQPHLALRTLLHGGTAPTRLGHSREAIWRRTSLLVEHSKQLRGADRTPDPLTTQVA